MAARLDLLGLAENSWRLTPDRLAAHVTRDEPVVVGFGDEQFNLSGPYQRPRHVRYLGAKIAKTIAKGNGRLLITLPPQIGKSQLVSRWTPTWAHYITQGRARVLLGSYEFNFAASWGRAVRDAIAKYGNELMLEVSSSTSASSEWQTTGGGGMQTAGVNSGMTGKPGDCFPGDTLIATPDGPTRIDSLVGTSRTVWGYDHARRTVTPRPIVASRRLRARALVEIRFASGRSIQCTPDHRIWIEGQGYVEARLVEVGSKVRTVRVPHLCELLEDVPAPGVRARQEAEEWGGGVLLLAGVRSSGVCSTQHGTLRHLRGAGTEGAKVLRSGLREGWSEEDDQAVSAVRHRLCPQVISPGLLRQAVRQPGALSADDRQGQLALQDGDVVRPVVSPDASGDPRSGRRLRDLRRLHPRTRRGDDPSHRRRPGEQPSHEPRGALHVPSHHPPQVGFDTVSMVAGVCGPGVDVYDIQVEGTSNFFADEVLVHNCIIIDDPFKDFKTAHSPAVRRDVWDWFRSVPMTRLQPGSTVIVVQTRWHEEDLVGHLTTEPGSEEWELVRIPALCDSADDPLGREIGEPIWPERFDVEHYRKIRQLAGAYQFAGMYQQLPAPLEGEMFKRTNWQHVDAAPSDLLLVRRWDLAGTEAGGDYTVGTLEGLSPSTRQVFIVDVQREQLSAFGVEKLIHDTAVADHERHAGRVLIRIEQEPGAMGKGLGEHYVKRVLQGFPAKAIPSTGDKTFRARPYSAQQEAQNVFLVRKQVGDTFVTPAWWDEFVEEHAVFGQGAANDDQVDTAAAAFSDLMDLLGQRSKAKVARQPQAPLRPAGPSSRR